MKDGLESLAQALKLLRALDKLDDLRGRTDLSFEDGCFLKQHISDFEMQQYWTAIAMNYEQSEDDAVDFMTNFKEKLEDHFYSKDMREALFKRLVEGQGLSEEVGGLQKQLPQQFVDVDSIASCSAWPPLHFDDAIKKAQVDFPWCRRVCVLENARLGVLDASTRWVSKPGDFSLKQERKNIASSLLAVPCSR